MSERLTPTENKDIRHAAAGNLAFLLSVIRCGESLSADEEANVRKVIERLECESQAGQAVVKAGVEYAAATRALDEAHEVSTVGMPRTTLARRALFAAIDAMKEKE